MTRCRGSGTPLRLTAQSPLRAAQDRAHRHRSRALGLGNVSEGGNGTVSAKRVCQALSWLPLCVLPHLPAALGHSQDISVEGEPVCILHTGNRLEEQGLYSGSQAGWKAQVYEAKGSFQFMGFRAQLVPWTSSFLLLGLSGQMLFSGPSDAFCSLSALVRGPCSNLF